MCTHHQNYPNWLSILEGSACLRPEVTQSREMRWKKKEKVELYISVTDRNEDFVSLLSLLFPFSAMFQS